MRFVLAKYTKNPLDINEPGKTIGVVVQSKNKAKLKFSKDTEKLKNYDELADLTIFVSLEKSLKDILRSKHVIISTPDEYGNSVVAATDTRFLEDLHNSYQGKNQFSEVQEANYTDIDEAVDKLYSSYVNL